MYAPLYDIIKAIGLPAAMKLVENFGGIRLYLPLPEKIDEHNQIAKVIGVDAARKLAESWERGPERRRPSIPLARRHLRAIVKSEIQRDRQKLTIPELALKYQTTERNIYRYLGEEPKNDTAQTGLF